MAKKIISSIITITIILSMFVVPHASAANLVKNSGFELTTNNWNVLESSAWYVTTKEKVEGRRGLAVTGRKQTYAAPQQFIDLQVGKTYTVSVWVKTGGGEDTLRLTAEGYKPEGGLYPAFTMSYAPINEDWTHIQETFTLQMEPYTRIKIGAQTQTLVDLYFDEFEVWEGTAVGDNSAPVATTAPKATEKPKLPTNPELENTSDADRTKINLISNSDFEKGVSGYKAENAELKQVKGVVSGNYAMQVIGTGDLATVTADADMINGKEYNLNMWYKGDAISVYTDGGAILYEGEKAKDWTLINENFVYTESGKKPFVSVEGYGEFYLDAFSLFEVPVVAENLGASSNLIASSDPGFEARSVNGNALGNTAFGNVNWISRGSAKVSDAQAHTGVNSVEVTSGSGPRAAVYNLTEGAQYFISAWVYPTQSGLKGELLLGGKSNSRTAKATLTANTWNQISGVVTAPAAGDAALTGTHGRSGNTLYLNMENLSSAMYIDDFEITPYDSVPIDTDNGPIKVNPEGITSEGKDIAQLWDFHCTPSTPGLMAGWRMRVGSVDGKGHYPFKPEHQDGITRLDLKLTSGWVGTERHVNYNIDADKYKYISIKAQNLSQAKTFQIGFFKPENMADSGRSAYNVKWPEGEGVQEIILDMSECEKWSGTIARLSYHPAKDFAVNEYGVAIDGQHVLLESISVFANEPATAEVIADNTITRAEFVDMLIEKLDLKNVTTDKPTFYDIGMEAPWRESIIAAQETGIISGNGAGYFNPGDYISREHVAVMVKRACDYLDKQTDRVIPAVNFADTAQFSAGMIDAASFLANTGIMTAAYGGYFNPKNTISAAEAEEIINRAIDWINGTTKNGGVFVSADVAGTYDIVRMSVKDENGASYTNAFDFEEVKADAVFTAPDGSTFVLPGFFDTLDDHSFDPRRISENISQLGEYYWKFRFSPTMAGEWKFEIRVTNNGKVTTLGSGKITAVETGRPGYLRSDKDNARFVYDNGDVFSAIGINLKCPIYDFDDGGYEVFEDYLAKYADENGINLIRTWFNTEDDKNLEDYQTGLGKYNGVHAQRMDYVYGLARQKGVAILPPILSFHMLTGTNWLYSRSPYASVIDGIIDVGAEFYSDEYCKKAYKSMLRYIVARYSAYDNVLLWELLNEEEGISGFRENIEHVSNWHDEMQAYMEEIDPYNHPVGSAGYTIGGEDFIFKKEKTDFTIAHNYDSVQPALQLRANAVLGRELYMKPQVIEEYSPHDLVAAVDINGEHIHETLWSSVAAGHAAACPAWWWWQGDVHKGVPWDNEHWKIYGPLTSFLEGLNWPDENLEIIDFKTTSAEKGDFIIPAGYYKDFQYKENAIGEAPIKTEFKYDFTKDCMRDITDMIWETKVTNTMPEYSIKVNLPKATEFKLALVGTPIYKSTISPGSVTISVDGVERRTDEWWPKDGFILEYPVTVPAGEHTITFKCSKGLIWLAWAAFSEMAPLVVAEGAVGDNSAVIYVRDTEAVFSKMVFNGYEPPVIAGATVDLTGLRDGAYDLIWWDTYKGGEVSRQEVTVSGGVAPTVEVPAFTKNIAAKLIRKSN